MRLSTYRYTSLAEQLGVMELVVWDKQTLTKEYVGEVSIPLEDWFCDKDKDGKDKEKRMDLTNLATRRVFTFMLFNMTTYLIR